MQREASISESVVSEEVAELVEHLWQEASGQLEETLSAPVESIKLEQVKFLTSNTSRQFIKRIKCPTPKCRCPKVYIPVACIQ